jgi:hypothetical protein
MRWWWRHLDHRVVRLIQPEESMKIFIVTSSRIVSNSPVGNVQQMLYVFYQQIGQWKKNSIGEEEKEGWNAYCDEGVREKEGRNLYEPRCA